MSTLTGYKPAETYKDLLHMSNSNNGVDTIARQVYDGEGHPTPLELSSTVVNFRTDNDFKFKIGGTAITSTANEINQLAGISTASTLASQISAKQNKITTELNKFIVGTSVSGVTENKTSSEVATMMGLKTCAYANTGSGINNVPVWKDATGSVTGFVFNDAGLQVKTASEAKTALGINTGDNVVFGTVQTNGHIRFKAGASSLSASATTNGNIQYVKYASGGTNYAKLQMVVQDNVGSYVVHDLISKSWS
tara:strand:+ start:584 stop:1336 length:753 start_codon:yes stop_codon:yes gene_type:complete